jgi:gamma-glutamylcyclotransferase (GGCT)/AIG2-like uncharacterized protein YtfP
MKNFFILICAVFLNIYHPILQANPSTAMPKKYYYFAYGSNMNTKVLRKLFNGDSLECLGCYKLNDYKFLYNRAPFTNQGFTGGNIQYEPGCAVYGVVWKISEGELAILDQFENSPKVYRRSVLEVVRPDNSQDVCQAEVYVANPNYISPICRPRPFYVNIVTEGAKEHHLPPDYIEQHLSWSGPWGEER